MTSYDDFLGGRLKLTQLCDGHRAGHDAVLLAASIDRGARICELGCGVGVGGLCVAHRLVDARVVMIDIMSELVALARENIERNGFSGRVEAHHGDICGAFTRLNQPRGGFDHVFMNPPYYEDSGVRRLTDARKRVAHQFAVGGLVQWIKSAASLVCARGRVSMIYRADGLARLLADFGKRFGDIRILPIHPKAGRAAHRVIVSGRRDMKAPLRILPPLILHERDGASTLQAEMILRHGVPLALWDD